MKFLKKGSLGILSFMCMLTIVGYINYEYNEEREKNLGRTVYVLADSGEVIKVENESKNVSSEYVYSENNIYSSFSEIQNNINKIEEVLNATYKSVIVTFNFENQKYDIIFDKNLYSNIDINEMLKDKLPKLVTEIRIKYL